MFLDQNHDCVMTTLLYLYQTFQVYNQSVVIVKTISSQSLHDVLSTLIILWWIFFLCLNFLKIYGIKCTGSVSSSLWIEMLSSDSFPFSFLSLCFYSSYQGGVEFQLCCHPVMASTTSTTVPAQQPLLLGGGIMGREGSWVEKEVKM